MPVKWMVCLLALAIAGGARAHKPLVFEFTGADETLSVHQEIVGPDIVGPDRSIKVLNIFSLQCNGQTYRLTYFLSQSNTDPDAIEGAALAAALGLLQGMDPAEVAKIVGPDLEIQHSELPAVMSSADAQLLSLTLFAALTQVGDMSDGKADPRVSAFTNTACMTGAPVPSVQPVAACGAPVPTCGQPVQICTDTSSTSSGP